jgi:SAM-dependent methyltransferase
MRRRMTVLSWAAACAVALVCAGATAQETQREVRRDVPYVPTPQEVVDEMLRMANVGRDDVVYDLGCGDGRLVITAVKKFGAKRGVGVDIDPQRIKESNENAKAAGVADRVKFLEQDLFKTDIKEATVVTLYLLPDVNLRLRPMLWSDLKPGTRVVSHAFDMGDWRPEKTTSVEGRSIYFWTIPAKPPAASGQ